MTDMTDALDPARMTISERNDTMAAAKSCAGDQEAKREQIARSGRALGIEIDGASFEVYAMKRGNVRAHLDKLLAEEAALKVEMRCISLALDQARRRVAELDAIFSRTPAASERDRTTRAELARRYGDNNNATAFDEAQNR